MLVNFRRVDWAYASVFRISHTQYTQVATVVVELRDGDLVGRGEGIGVSYHGETPDKMMVQLENVRAELEANPSRESLQTLLPPGGALNAVDCAMWDLEAKRAGRRVWELAEIPAVAPTRTDFTLSLDTPEAMAASAGQRAAFSALKIKLGGEGDFERVAAIRKARPDANLIVDANQGWTENQLHEFTPKLAALGVTLIEQPLPVGGDEALRNYKSPVPLCADESCQTVDSLSDLVGKYDFVNIKLDKTGGLTGALALANAARTAGFKLMVGCMAGSSLSMAPAFVIAQLCEIVDLDGPLLFASDMPDAIEYVGDMMHPPVSKLWG